MAATHEQWTECFDNRKNFYSRISYDIHHVIEITYEDMTNNYEEIVGKIWWVQMICYKPGFEMHSGYGFLRCFESFTEAKKKMFELKTNRCKICCDENGVPKKRI